MGGNTSSVVNIRLVDNLPLVSAKITVEGRSVELKNVLVDTGSGGSIFSADVMLGLGLKPSVDDTLHVITGVGGEEYAFSKTVKKLSVGEIVLEDFKIQIGAMDYGFELDGILGMSFLLPVRATLDFEELVLAGVPG